MLYFQQIERVQVPYRAPDNDNPNLIPIGDGFGFFNIRLLSEIGNGSAGAEAGTGIKHYLYVNK